MSFAIRRFQRRSWMREKRLSRIRRNKVLLLNHFDVNFKKLFVKMASVKEYSIHFLLLYG